MEELKPTEKQIYDFIVKFISEHGYSPSYREICKGVFLCSTQTIHANMRRLAYFPIRSEEQTSELQSL